MKPAIQHRDAQTLAGQPIKPVRNIKITNACSFGGEHHAVGETLKVDPGLALDLIAAGKAVEVPKSEKAIKSADPAVENRDPKGADESPKKK